MSREDDSDSGFLSRWSKRKLTKVHPDEQPQQDGAEQDVHDVAASEPAAAEQQMVEAETQESPIWQQQDADPEQKKKALRALFQKPEFNQRDGLNEYDDDFTQFASLGNIVTHEMKRMLKLAEEHTRPDKEAEDDTPAMEDEQQSEQQQNHKQEDDGVA